MFFSHCWFIKTPILDLNLQHKVPANASPINWTHTYLQQTLAALPCSTAWILKTSSSALTPTFGSFLLPLFLSHRITAYKAQSIFSWGLPIGLPAAMNNLEQIHLLPLPQSHTRGQLLLLEAIPGSFIPCLCISVFHFWQCLGSVSLTSFLSLSLVKWKTLSIRTAVHCKVLVFQM